MLRQIFYRKNDKWKFLKAEANNAASGLGKEIK